MKHVLVTGANGFVGSSLVRTLLKEGCRVSAFRRKGSNLSRINDLKKDIDWYALEGGVEIAFQKMGHVDIIVHLATCYGKNESISEVFGANVNFPLSLLESAGEKSIPLFISTDSFFSKQEYSYNYLKSYIFSKKVFSGLGRLYSEEKRLRFVNMRLEHVYGPGDSPDKFVPTMVNQLKRNVESIKLTDGSQQRDFVYIDDVISAYMAVINCNQNQLKPFSEFEVGRGECISIRTFVEKLKFYLGSRSVLKFGELKGRDGEISKSCANIKALTNLGWKPHLDIDTGIRHMIEAGDL